MARYVPPPAPFSTPPLAGKARGEAPDYSRITDAQMRRLYAIAMSEGAYSKEGFARMLRFYGYAHPRRIRALHYERLCEIAASQDYAGTFDAPYPIPGEAPHVNCHRGDDFDLAFTLSRASDDYLIRQVTLAASRLDDYHPATAPARAEEARTLRFIADEIAARLSARQSPTGAETWPNLRPLPPELIEPAEA